MENSEFRTEKMACGPRQPSRPGGLLGFLLLFAILVSPVFVNAQSDTLDFDRLEPTYYYWDSCWIGYYVHRQYVYPLESAVTLGKYFNLVLEHGMESYKSDAVVRCQIEKARYFHSDSVLRIMGVAAPMYFRIYEGGLYDPDTSHCLPEYFILYRINDKGVLIPVDSVRNDTVSSRRYMMLLTYQQNFGMSAWSGQEWEIDTLDTISIYYPVSEVYFRRPVEMQGDFYLSGTANNNYKVKILADSIYIPAEGGVWWYSYYYKKAHPYTAYRDMSPWAYAGQNYWINNGYIRPYKFRAHMIDDANDWEHDTVWHTYALPNIDLAFFLIFDTSRYIPPAVSSDTCPPPVALRVMNRIGDTVTFIWNGPDSVRYEVQVTRSDSPGIVDTSCVVTNQFATVMGFDTSTWYTARVRTLCDSSRYSDWGDSVQFYIPAPRQDNDEDTTMSVDVSLKEQYTFLMPNPATNRVTMFSSFYITDVTLFTIDGREMGRFDVGAASAEVDVSSLPRGAYIVRITTSRGPVFRKLILR